jgi:hypothetical protein
LSLDDGYAPLGAFTTDVSLNDQAFWSNIPSRVWTFTIDGYPVLKKELSAREHIILGRALKPVEGGEFRDVACRIAAILLLEPTLDANYQVVTANIFDWSTVVHKPSTLCPW